MKIQTFKTINKEKGVSSLEYIILMTAVISMLIIVLGPQGIFSQAISSTYSSSINGMVDLAQSLTPPASDVDQTTSTLPDTRP